MDVKDIESSARFESLVVIRIDVRSRDLMPSDGHEFADVEQEYLSLEKR